MSVGFQFYEHTFNNLNAALSSYVGSTASSIIGAISGVAYSMLMIYMMLWGWAMLRGMISEPITDGLARIIRLSVITGIALSLGRYNTYVSNFLWDSPDALASIIASGYSNSTSNVQYLDALLTKIYDLGQVFWSKGQAAGAIVPDFGLLMIALLVWTAGVAATAYGAFLLALSKMALAILLGIGPIFVLLLIFEGTKRFFESWLGQALNYVFLVALTASAIKLIMTIIDKYLLQLAPLGADPNITQALPVIVLCVIAALVMMQLPSIASALGGGAAISTLGAAGWAYGKTTNGMTAGRNLVTGKTLSDMRGQRRTKAINARWAARNPSMAAKAASTPMAVYRRVTAGPKNRVSQG